MEGGSTDRESSCGAPVDRREFLGRFVDARSLSSSLEGWLLEQFDVPFELIDLQQFDYALEAVPFQQLVRMPSAVYASTSAAAPSAFLALEDFLHASLKCLWHAFWSDDAPLPFYVSSISSSNFRFHAAEKAIAKGTFSDLCATAVMLKNPRHPHGKWDDVLLLALLRPDVVSTETSDSVPSTSAVSEALFFAVRVLLARSLTKSSIPLALDSAFVLLLDSQCGGVLKLEGDVNKLEMDVNDVYGCAAEWIKTHCRVSISPVDRVWNKLGNANWGDIGAMQLLFATFNSMVQYAGVPNNTVEDLAADHSCRLQARRIERQMGGDATTTRVNGLFRLQQQPSTSAEIVEVHDDELEAHSMKLEAGSVLWVEDPEGNRGYQIREEILSDGEDKSSSYIASSLDDHTGTPLFLYVGSPPSQLEPAWEDMKLWYQVQRQTKVLGIMKHKGLNSRYLPQLCVSGRILHPGQCRRPSSGGNCDHPWCGTCILVTTPVGPTVADMVRAGEFGAEDAIRCCHDSLSALHTAASAGIRHGDIRPENMIHVTTATGKPYFVMIGWGHAILEDRDRPAMNLHFSSTYALQEGKLCSASDAESLVYMLYFSSGGELPELDSVEGALQWRERCWSRRLIQQKLGDISAVLKAFADYVDSLCGTPYPIDYDIWLRRLRRHMNDDNQAARPL